MSSRLLYVCLLAAATSACAAKAPVSGATDERRPSSSRNRDLITQADLSADASLRAQSVLDIIRSLRPHFLVDQGSNSLQATGLSDPDAGKVHASIDNGRVVSVSELSGMHGSEISEIRYLNSAQAMQKFGTAARQGPVILVLLAK